MRNVEERGAGGEIIEWQPRRRSARRGTAHDAAAAAVIEIVEAEFGVSREMLLRQSRCEAEVAHARQVAMYLCYIVLGRQHAAIGRIFGRDRSTVSYACARIEDQRDDSSFDARLIRLEAEITESEAAAAQEEVHRAAI